MTTLFERTKPYPYVECEKIGPNGRESFFLHHRAYDGTFADLFDYDMVSVGMKKRRSRSGDKVVKHRTAYAHFYNVTWLKNVNGVRGGYEKGSTCPCVTFESSGTVVAQDHGRTENLYLKAATRCGDFELMAGYGGFGYSKRDVTTPQVRIVDGAWRFELDLHDYPALGKHRGAAGTVDVCFTPGFAIKINGEDVAAKMVDGPRNEVMERMVALFSDAAQKK